MAWHKTKNSDVLFPWTLCACAVFKFNSLGLLETSTTVSILIVLTAQSQPMVLASPSVLTSNWRPAVSRAWLSSE